MTMLTRDIAKKSTYFKREKVDVTELGMIPSGKMEPEHTFVWVTEVPASVRDEIEEEMTIQKRGKIKIDLENMRARVAVKCCRDDDGNSIFQPGDEEWLAEKSAAAMSRIYDAYSRLNGLSEEDKEELEKNLTNRKAKPRIPCGSTLPNTSEFQAFES